MPIKTTCLGAYPKPDYVPIKDWFIVDLGEENYQADVVDTWSDAPEHDAAFQRATQEVMADQINCGIDIPTDGEQRRENYVHYQCRQFEGFDFKNLVRREMRSGAYHTDLPAIRGKITAGHRILPRDYREAQAASAKFDNRPVKITLPGPITIMDTTADEFYNDDRALARDLATALNGEVLALAEAGCQHIQVDEPVFARKPDVALSYGVEMLERVFHGVPAGVTRVSHMCCGYPDRLDNPDYPKADHQVYYDLVTALDGKIDALSIEDCHCGNNLDLFERFNKTKAITGFVDIATSRVESVDEIVERMRDILKIIPAENLIAAPDCGLGFLGRELTLQKLTNMCKAAALV
ncbi:MAG: 5-methyltetrahydropteroyltriglutamate--homocysteine methyltransferase [Paracoccaceae bacterium]|jgi:5-methyltetrahydropteroyltriglutamate--homocysteine methyltransferase